MDQTHASLFGFELMLFTQIFSLMVFFLTYHSSFQGAAVFYWLLCKGRRGRPRRWWNTGAVSIISNSTRVKEPKGGTLTCEQGWLKGAGPRRNQSGVIASIGVSCLILWPLIESFYVPDVDRYSGICLFVRQYVCTSKLNWGLSHHSKIKTPSGPSCRWVTAKHKNK